MVHLILTGATGLVGSSVLSHILSLPASSSPVIHRVSILTRNTSIPMLSPSPPTGTPSTNKHTQIEVIEHEDFNSYPPDLLERLKGADACIWALGVSQNDVSSAEYVKITKDYTLAAATAFSSLAARGGGGGGKGGGAGDDAVSNGGVSTSTSTAPAGAAGPRKFNFIYVSGEGATETPKPWTPIFGRVKGETERELLRLSHQPAHAALLRVFSPRPGGVDGRMQPWIWDAVMQAKRSAWQRVYLRSLLSPMRGLDSLGVTSAMYSPTDELGKVLVDLAVGDASHAFVVGQPGVESGGEGRTLGNKALRLFAKGQLKRNQDES